MRYVAYAELDGIPNIVVDGASHRDSLLTLSHWPKSGSPVELRDDLTAQIVFRYLDRPDLHVPAVAVSNNHFDQDGLMSVYALVDPAGAQSRREQAIDVARAGDFGTFRERSSVRIAWTIAVLEEEQAGDADPYALYLERVPELLDRPDRFRDLWAEEDEHLEQSEAAIGSGEIVIEELDAIDLAIVTVPESWAIRPVHRFTIPGAQAVHPSAVSNATDRFRVLVVHGDRYEVQYRYETWVQYASQRPAGRIDLKPLAALLSELEPRDARWTFDGVEAIAPAFHLIGAGPDAASAIPREQFRARLIDALTNGAEAWDPYD